jgi:hypothetical protein
MAKRTILMIGDLVQYIGHGSEDYKSMRQAGVILDKHNGMFKVKWASGTPTCVWYQGLVLRKINKKSKNNLTKSSKELNYNSNTKEFTWK